MPDKRKHRGAHPSDAELFSAEALHGLRRAVADYSFLLSNGYGDKGALKLVGDHFSLTQRQRTAIMRCACSDEQKTERKRKQLDLDHTKNESLVIDAYNLLITVEASLGGGIIFKGRDGCLRDLASIHGTYRKVEETIPALELIGEFLAQHPWQSITWFLDQPVSNSGRLKVLMAELAEKNQWQWNIQIVPNPDKTLSQSDHVVATSDSVILDNCSCWINLARAIIESCIPSYWMVVLS